MKALGVCRWIGRWVEQLGHQADVHISRTCDREGNCHWHTYDRHSRHHADLSSEAEVRIWLEQRHYP